MATNKGKQPGSRPLGVEDVSAELTPEDVASLGDGAAVPPEAVDEDAGDAGDVPAWAHVPDDLRMPAGRQMTFLLVKAVLTPNPGQGDHDCVTWPLTVADEKLARKRINNDSNAIIEEQTRQWIRAVDGVRVRWDAKRGQPGNIDDWWEAIGPKGRKLVMSVYLKVHSCTGDEQLDFFTNCVAFRTATPA